MTNRCRFLRVGIKLFNHLDWYWIWLGYRCHCWKRWFLQISNSYEHFDRKRHFIRCWINSRILGRFPLHRFLGTKAHPIVGFCYSYHHCKSFVSSLQLHHHAITVRSTDRRSTYSLAILHGIRIRCPQGELSPRLHLPLLSYQLLPEFWAQHRTFFFFVVNQEYMFMCQNNYYRRPLLSQERYSQLGTDLPLTESQLPRESLGRFSPKSLSTSLEMLEVLPEREHSSPISWRFSLYLC